MKKTLGWGYALTTETIEEAKQWYLTELDPFKTKEAALENLKAHQNYGSIDKNAEIRVFEITVNIN